MADERDQIRSRINIVDLVSQKVVLRKTGRTFKGLCPFHDDRNPSMDVDPTMGRYKCWSCGAGGDVFTWVMETQRVDFAEALQILADQAGVTLTRQSQQAREEKKNHDLVMKAAQDFYRSQLAKSPVAQAYCAQRGLDDEVLATWGLGYAPQGGDLLATTLGRQGFSLAEAKELFLVDLDGSGGYYDKFRSRLMIPICDDRGRIIAYGGRIIGDGQPKYINSSDTPLFHKSSVLFGLHNAKDRIAASGFAVLVEGYMDVIACHRAGVTQAVASLGTAFTEDQIKLLRRWCQQVVILYDRDEAGQKAAEKASEMLLDAGMRVRIALPPVGEDPDSLLTKQGPASVMDVVQKAVTTVSHRVMRVREKVQPTDPSFWDAASVALSYAANPLELEEHLAPLASLYPNAPDKNSAMDALRRMAGQAKRNRRSGSQAPPPEASPRNTGPLRLPPFQAGKEGLILRALMDPLLTALAWQACREPGLFRAGTGELAARAIVAAFPEAPPQGEVSEWIHQIDDESVKDLMMSLLGQGGALIRSDAVMAVERVSAEDLAAAVENLREHRQRRELDLTSLSGQDDEALRALSESLRKRKAT